MANNFKLCESRYENTELAQRSDSKLLLVINSETGKKVGYFTNVNRAAKFLGTQNTYLMGCVYKPLPHYKQYIFEWVDGRNVSYKFINPN